MNLKDNKARPAYIVFRNGEKRSGEVIKVDENIYYRTKKRNTRWGRREWTQLRPLPSGAALFVSAKAYATQGQKLKKVYWASYNGEEVETLEKAPDGSLWLNGARVHRDPEKIHKTLRAAKVQAVKRLLERADHESKRADDIRKRVKALRAKARRTKP